MIHFKKFIYDQQYDTGSMINDVIKNHDISNILTFCIRSCNQEKLGFIIKYKIPSNFDKVDIFKILNKTKWIGYLKQFNIMKI